MGDSEDKGHNEFLIIEGDTKFLIIMGTLSF